MDFGRGRGLGNFRPSGLDMDLMDYGTSARPPLRDFSPGRTWLASRGARHFNDLNDLDIMRTGIRDLPSRQHYAVDYLVRRDPLLDLDLAGPRRRMDPLLEVDLNPLHIGRPIDPLLRREPLPDLLRRDPPLSPTRWGYMRDVGAMTVDGGYLGRPPPRAFDDSFLPTRHSDVMPMPRYRPAGKDDEFHWIENDRFSDDRSYLPAPRRERGRRNRKERDRYPEYYDDEEENPYHLLPAHIPKDDYDNAMKRNLHVWSQWRTGLNKRGAMDNPEVCTQAYNSKKLQFVF